MDLAKWENDTVLHAIHCLFVEWNVVNFIIAIHFLDVEKPTSL